MDKVSKSREEPDLRINFESYQIDNGYHFSNEGNAKLVDVSEWALQAAFSEKGHRFPARCYLYKKN